MDQEKRNNLTGIKLFEKGQEQAKQQSHMVLALEFEPRPHWWEWSFYIGWVCLSKETPPDKQSKESKKLTEVN